MIISQEVKLIIIQKRTVQNQPFQAQVSMFQTVYSDPLRQEVMAVRCVALQLRICLLSRLLSSLAKQAVVKEEPFTFPIVVVNVFYMRYVVMTVAQHTQVLLLITNLRIYM
jgi:hypothetical protein